MMETTSIYQDMAQRTGGSVYIGVVGPVRTGKSTFVKRFMETLVLPHIENSYRRDRAHGRLRVEIPVLRPANARRTVLRELPPAIRAIHNRISF